MVGARASGLTIISTAPLSATGPEALRGQFSEIEIIELSIPGDDALSGHAGELNRAMDAAKYSWILLLRDRETIGAELAREIAEICLETPTAWAFRIRRVILYRGARLSIGQHDGGGIRLFHRRHCRFGNDVPHVVKVQGTVVRLKGAIESVSFSSSAEHERALQRAGVPHSLPRRVARFVALALACRPWWRVGTNGLRYLWIEAGFDVTPPGQGISRSSDR